LVTEPPAAARRAIPLVLALFILLLVAASLVVGGLYVRSFVSKAFRDADRVRNARAHVNDMLRQQLDEETGVRGYAAARLPVLLHSYYGGRANLPLQFARVRGDLEALKVQEALPVLRDAEIANYRWLHEVAYPLIVKPGARPALLLRGKTLVDRFRIDAAKIYSDLTRRTTIANARAGRALVLLGLFALAAILAVIGVALIFTVQQYRLGRQLDREVVASERERHQAAEARAAYATEKRIADVLQEAFAERLFPELPTVRFSATYVPATEEAKIGGDWYDALQLAKDRVLLAIGDVTGHGIEAVVAMNKARQLLIGSALLDATPGRVLERVNNDLVRGRSPIVTAIAGCIDTNTYEFTYAAAGHPPPILLEPGKRARLLGFGSLPLGVKPNVEYVTHRIQTAPGTIIVLYTDGAIEYSRNLAAGESTLLEAVESAAQASEHELAGFIGRTIFGDWSVADDVAILTVQFADGPSGRELARQAGAATFTRTPRRGKPLESQPNALRRSA
jgi:serine phosphatase RsbU (regulator of sigma subunit)